MTIIVADTTCGLPLLLLEERCIPLIPQIVTFREESYHDNGDLDTATFLSKLKTFPTLPKTSAPEPSMCITGRGCPKGEARALVEELKSKVSDRQIPIYELPPAIVVHAGPKAMGVGFFVE